MCSHIDQLISLGYTSTVSYFKEKRYINIHYYYYTFVWVNSHACHSPANTSNSISSELYWILDRVYIVSH